MIKRITVTIFININYIPNIHKTHEEMLEKEPYYAIANIDFFFEIPHIQICLGKIVVFK